MPLKQVTNLHRDVNLHTVNIINQLIIVALLNNFLFTAIIRHIIFNDSIVETFRNFCTF